MEKLLQSLKAGRKGLQDSNAAPISTMDAARLALEREASLMKKAGTILGISSKGEKDENPAVPNKKFLHSMLRNSVGVNRITEEKQYEKWAVQQRERIDSTKPRSTGNTDRRGRGYASGGARDSRDAAAEGGAKRVGGEEGRGGGGRAGSGREPSRSRSRERERNRSRDRDDSSHATASLS
ncbi:hypothetical protein T484DRAFT_1889095, partial [Baffinella frigidus]